MDGKRFDRLTRALASGQSRRSLLKGVLGISGTAAVASVTIDEAGARRRGRTNTPTTPPPPPTTTTTAEPCLGTSCGLDCCPEPDQCCNGECCPDQFSCLTYYFPEGPYVEEETCCRNELICDTTTTKCCADGEQCCTRDGVSYCIPDDGCCVPEECPQPGDQCLMAACPVGDWTCGTAPVQPGTPCNDGDPCTSNDACNDIGQCAGIAIPPVDCQVTEWSPWSDCSKVCAGTQTRTRTIITDPSCGGAACPPLEETQPCNSEPCGTGACNDVQVASPCTTWTFIDGSASCFGGGSLSSQCCSSAADCPARLPYCVVSYTNTINGETVPAECPTNASLGLCGAPSPCPV